MKQIVFLGLILFSSYLAQSQSKNFIDQPYIEISAKVDTSVYPDKISISILLSEDDLRKKRSIEDLEKSMINSLKNININPTEQLEIVDLSSNFKKYIFRKKDIRKKKKYQLTVYNAKSAVNVFIAMEEIGISNIQIVKTEYSEEENLKLKLKIKAVQKAKKQAQDIMKGLNQKVGKAIHVFDTNTEFGFLQGRTAGIAVMSLSLEEIEDEAPLIEFEKIKLVSNVTVKFTIQ